MRDALFRFIVLLALIAISPVALGFFNSFGCIDRTTDENVFQRAKAAYLKKLFQIKTASLADGEFVKCGPPTAVEEILFGIPTGTQWRAFCAYIKENTVYTSEAFNINRCSYTKDWEFVDEGFPKSLAESGYGDLL